MYFNLGVNYVNLRNYDVAIENFKKANLLQKRDVTYSHLGKCYQYKEDYQKAIEVYLEAL